MLLFLYGEDDFRSGEKLSELKNKFSEKNVSGALSVFDFEGDSAKAFIDVSNAGGLFSQKKLIIGKNLLTLGNKENQEKVLDFLKRKKDLISLKDSILIFWEKSVPRKNGRLFKFLSQNSKVQEFKKLSGTQLKNWVEKKITVHGSRFTEKVIDKLILYVGDDLWRMNNEINKLTTYNLQLTTKDKRKKEITEQDVDLLVKSKIEANIFETIEALSSGDKKKALKLLHSQLEFGDDPHYIFSMYVYQFRNLLKIGSFYFQGKTNYYEIAKLAKLHPFVVQKALAQLKNFNSRSLKNIYRKLQEIDLQVKTGKVDIGLALDMFVVEM